MRRIILLSLALPLLLGSKAAAQACLGMPSFATAPMQVAGSANFGDGASAFGATFGYGVPNGLYGKAGVGTTSYDGVDASSFDFGVSGGYQIKLASSKKTELCPVASLGFGSGPNDVVGDIDMSSRTFAFGMAGGTSVGRNPRLLILPNASFQFANTRIEIDDVAGSESYGLLTLGTGFVFNSRFSVNPSISIPVGLDGSDASFGLAGAINFGN